MIIKVELGVTFLPELGDEFMGFLDPGETWDGTP
jgi:hypothetical protein